MADGSFSNHAPSKNGSEDGVVNIPSEPGKVRCVACATVLRKGRVRRNKMPAPAPQVDPNTQSGPISGVTDVTSEATGEVVSILSSKEAQIAAKQKILELRQRTEVAKVSKAYASKDLAYLKALLPEVRGDVAAAEKKMSFHLKRQYMLEAYIAKLEGTDVDPKAGLGDPDPASTDPASAPPSTPDPEPTVVTSASKKAKKGKNKPAPQASADPAPDPAPAVDPGADPDPAPASDPASDPNAGLF